MKRGTIDSPTLKKVLLCIHESANSPICTEELMNKTELTRDRLFKAIQSLRTKGVLKYRILPDDMLLVQVINDDVIAQVVALERVPRSAMGTEPRHRACPNQDTYCWLSKADHSSCFYLQGPWHYRITD